MWLWTGFPMSDGGTRLPRTIKTFPGDRPVACSALPFTVSATRPPSPGPRTASWAPRGHSLWAPSVAASPPLGSPGWDTVLLQFSPPGLPTPG